MKSINSILLSALFVTSAISAPLQVRGEANDADVLISIGGSGAWLKTRDEAAVETVADENAVDIPTFDSTAGWIKGRHASAEPGNEVDAILNDNWVKKRDSSAVKEVREEANALDDLLSTESIEGSPVWL